MNYTVANTRSSLKSSNLIMNNIAGRVSATNSDGFKGPRDVQSTIFLENGVAGIQNKTLGQVSKRGGNIATDNALDLAIGNNRGFMIFNDDNEGVVYGRTAQLYVDKFGYLKAGMNDATIMGWRLDKNEEKPIINSNLESLEKVNIKQLISEGAQTTKITVDSVILNSQEEISGDAQTTLNMYNSGSTYNAYISNTDPIYANGDNLLVQGEGLSMVTYENGKRVTHNLVYGGVSEGAVFSAAGTDLVSDIGSIIKLNIGGIQYDIEVYSASEAEGTNTDNLGILTNMAAQINNKTVGNTQAYARVVNNNGNATILITPKVSNMELSYSGDDALKNKLGFTKDQEISSPGSTRRFSNLEQLKERLEEIIGPKTVFTSEENNGTLTIVSDPEFHGIFFDNYNPLGKGSNFLKEFDLTSGFIKSSYNPYDPLKNISGGEFKPTFNKDISVYDSMGNKYDLIVNFMRVDATKWAVETHITDPSAIADGRIDGLLQAGYLNFDGSGVLQSFEEASQISVSDDISASDIPLGFENGKTMTIGVGDTVDYTFTYDVDNSASTIYDGTLTDLANGTGANTTTDQLTVTVNGNSYTFARGTGTTNLAVMNDIADQINNQVYNDDADRLYATVVNTSGTNYELQIKHSDITKGLTFTGTNNLNTQLGLVDRADDNYRFRTLNDLAYAINKTSGIDTIEAEVIGGDGEGTFSLCVFPSKAQQLLTFSSDSTIAGPPLSNGKTLTLHDALGLQSTTSNNRIPSLTENINIAWSNSIGADNSDIEVDYGVVGQVNKGVLMQAQNSQGALSQNGISTGSLQRIQFDQDGHLEAVFDNESVIKIYKLALADFANPDGLTAVNGNMFKISKDSGDLIIKDAGTQGLGTIQSGVTEGSNVETMDEMTKLMEVKLHYEFVANILGDSHELQKYLLNKVSS